MVDIPPNDSGELFCLGSQSGIRRKFRVKPLSVAPRTRSEFRLLCSEVSSQRYEPGPILVTSNLPYGVSGPYLRDPLKCIDGASAATN